MTAGDAQKKNRLRKVTFFACCYDPLKERITHAAPLLPFPTALNSHLLSPAVVGKATSRSLKVGGLSIRGCPLSGGVRLQQ